METKKQSLFNISEEIINVTRQIEDNFGEITQEQEVQLSLLLNESKDKVSSYIHFLKKIDAEKEFVKAQIQEASLYIKRLENTSNRMLEVAKSVIVQTGNRLEGQMGSYISLRKSEQVKVNVDAELLPIEYTRIKLEPNKEKIKIDLKNGISLEFAELITNQSVTYK